MKNKLSKVFVLSVLGVFLSIPITSFASEIETTSIDHGGGGTSQP